MARLDSSEVDKGRLLIIRRRITVRGIVQGVGFRPYVFRLARHHHLSGGVLNDQQGVTIEVEGEEASILAFTTDLQTKAPPRAMIISVEFLDLPAAGTNGFEIQSSRKSAPMATLISPDLAVCDECLGEMHDSRNRRYQYPFINCINCGPRYTIIEDIPYDRPKTSMKHFTMCESCSNEYNDPLNRRFHAQPNACKDCGPRLILYESEGGESEPAVDPLEETVKRLKEGKIAAIKGLGGFHLVVDALNQKAVMRLRMRKHREEKPLAIMVPDLERAGHIVHLSPEETAELASPRKPIILARKKKGNPVAPAVSPGNDHLGVMLPYTPVHHLLFFRGAFMALVMTSGNASEEPICIDNDESRRRLSGIADFYLAHDRLIYLRSDDSVVRFFRGKRYPLRRSRGYAPAPVILKKALRPTLALGAELKNTLCLTKGNLAFLSQHVGDMVNEEAYAFFLKTLGHLEKILDERAEILAYDLHPDYLGTRFALDQNERPALGVQHHHAHAVSCMAEHQLEGPVLAVTFDGTGYGEDGHLWGGEFLMADTSGFKRVAHLMEVPMPGGDAAIREPYRMALSYLHTAYGTNYPVAVEHVIGRFPRQALEVLTAMIRQGINLFPTSSAGRLFDAVSSLLGLRDTVSFEGQAAMELEWSCSKNEHPGHYDFGIDNSAQVMVINTVPVIQGIVGDLGKGVERGTIAVRFHQTLADMISHVLMLQREAEGIDTVVLSGGVFQNMNLLGRTVTILEREGFDVYFHEQVPANDGGVSLGQAVIAHENYFHGGGSCA